MQALQVEPVRRRDAGNASAPRHARCGGDRCISPRASRAHSGRDRRHARCVRAGCTPWLRRRRVAARESSATAALVTLGLSQRCQPIARAAVAHGAPARRARLRRERSRPASYRASALEPIDRRHETGAAHVEQRRERPPALVVGQVLDDGRIAEGAAGGDADEGVGGATELPCNGSSVARPYLSTVCHRSVNRSANDKCGTGGGFSSMINGSGSGALCSAGIAKTCIPAGTSWKS